MRPNLRNYRGYGDMWEGSRRTVTPLFSLDSSVDARSYALSAAVQRGSATLSDCTLPLFSSSDTARVTRSPVQSNRP